MTHHNGADVLSTKRSRYEVLSAEAVHDIESIGLPVPVQFQSAEDLKFTTWKTYKDELDTGGHTDIFGQNDSLVARDSGFSDVKNIVYPMKYLTAVSIIVCVLSNVYAIVAADLPLIFGQEDAVEVKGFLITTALGNSLFGEDSNFPMHRILPGLELVFLGILTVHLLILAVSALLFPLVSYQDEDYKQLVRWTSAAQLFWEVLPALTTFSCMKLLYYVTPSVFSTEAYNVSVEVQERYDAGQRLKGVRIMLWYICSRSFFLLLGFDAFLVKFRIAEAVMNGEDYHAKHAVLGAVFLFQVLSIVNLNVFVRERLFLFLFAGEDGKLSLDEQCRKDIWQALLARQMFRELGYVKGLVALISFDDYDYQMLVLDSSQKAGSHTASACQSRAPSETISRERSMLIEV